MGLTRRQDIRAANRAAHDKAQIFQALTVMGTAWRARVDVGKDEWGGDIGPVLCEFTCKICNRGLRKFLGGGKRDCVASVRSGA